MPKKPARRSPTRDQGLATTDISLTPSKFTPLMNQNSEKPGKHQFMEDVQPMGFVAQPMGDDDKKGKRKRSPTKPKYSLPSPASSSPPKAKILVELSASSPNSNLGSPSVIHPK